MNEKEILECRINDQRFKIIRKLDENGKSIFTTFNPINNTAPTRTATILDQPELVNWEKKESHLKTVGVISGTERKYDYTFAIAGSFSVNSGTTECLKSENAEVILCPIGAMDSRPFPQHLVILGNCGSGTMLSIYSDSPCWLAYASDSGTVRPI